MPWCSCPSASHSRPHNFCHTPTSWQPPLINFFLFMIRTLHSSTLFYHEAPARSWGPSAWALEDALRGQVGTENFGGRKSCCIHLSLSAAWAYSALSCSPADRFPFGINFRKPHPPCKLCAVPVDIPHPTLLCQPSGLSRRHRGFFGLFIRIRCSHKFEGFHTLPGVAASCGCKHDFLPSACCIRDHHSLSIFPLFRT